MQTFYFKALFFVLMMSTTSAGQVSHGEMLIAGAAEASVTTPQVYRIEDNYCDPARFVKYYIRRPPALA